MEFKEPKVFLVGETKTRYDGLFGYLRHIGALQWGNDNFTYENERYQYSPIHPTDATDAEKLAEVYSRLCYRSYGVGLNPNIKKVREGNESHLQNVISSRHGSVLEHITLNFVFCDVSRVFTHELVRHRAGTAISQESLRYVRLDKLKAYLPECFKGRQEKEIMANVFALLENYQVQLAQMNNLDDEESFAKKKNITSAMRRLAPIGLLTNIGWSANIRALRHIIPLRTARGAEEEIRKVFSEVGHIVRDAYPHFFADFNFNCDTITMEGGGSNVGQWVCTYEKV